jgi:hypothetical protein
MVAQEQAQAPPDTGTSAANSAQHRAEKAQPTAATINGKSNSRPGVIGRRNAGKRKWPVSDDNAGC